jgi:hypothetical protein
MSIERMRARDLQARTNFAMTPAGKRSHRSTGEAEVRQPSAESVPSARAQKPGASSPDVMCLMQGHSCTRCILCARHADPRAGTMVGTCVRSSRPIGPNDLHRPVL